MIGEAADDSEIVGDKDDRHAHALLEFAELVEAAAVGLPDELKGEIPRAYVTLNAAEDARGDVLCKWLNERVGKHERVDSVVVRDVMPKTMIGKLDRKALKEEVLSPPSG